MLVILAWLQEYTSSIQIPIMFILQDMAPIVLLGIALLNQSIRCVLVLGSFTFIIKLISLIPVYLKN